MMSTGQDRREGFTPWDDAAPRPGGGYPTGFTLIELILVITMIAILAAAVLPRVVGRSEQARKARTHLDVANIEGALDTFALDVGRYPTAQEGLSALLTEPSGANGWQGPYVKRHAIPKDPWGQEYRYVHPGVHNAEDYDLFSLGPDGVEGSEDDITNWDEVEL